MEQKDKEVVITISGILIFIGILLFLIFINPNYAKIENLESSGNLIFFLQVQPIYDCQEIYKGFSLESNENDFTKIENAIDKLGITQDDYPLLNKIVYDTRVKCDGQYDPNIKAVYFSPCDEELYIRNYRIEQRDAEAFILAHELGHYAILTQITGDANPQDSADEYARILSKTGKRQ